MRDNGYDIVKRIIIAFGSIVGWIVSFRFSVLGFNVQVPNDQWAAVGLVIMFTALELAFSRTRLKLAATLILGAFVAYGYGIWTNVLGIYVIMHPAATTLAGAAWDQLVIPISAGTGLEVIPEALLVYAIFPETASEVSDSMRNFGQVFVKLGASAWALLNGALAQPRPRGVRPASPRLRPQVPAPTPPPTPRYVPQHRPQWSDAGQQGYRVPQQQAPSYRPSVSTLTGMGMAEEEESDEQ